MNIVACIKQVPNTTDVKINPDTGTLQREGVDAVINPFDTYAVEEAIRLKERMPGSKVYALSMGPPQAEKALRETLELGIDEAILLSDRAFAGADTLATSYTLAAAIDKIGDVLIILCGKQATDGDTAQVGPGIAEHLGIPHIAYVKKIEKIDKKNIVVERMMEDGYDVIEAPVPVLLTVVKEINEPRLPSLKLKIAARKKQIAVWNASCISVDQARIGLDGSPTVVSKIFTPPARTGGEKLSSNPVQAAEELIAKLKELKII
ncbi:MAG: electron transfer flavoprotein subunit beta/FixA family protein [bacterium]